MGKIIHNGIVYGGSSTSAGNVSYNNTASGLISTTVQNAITELRQLIDDNDLQQLSELPTPSVSQVGKIVQYVGNTTANYTHGYIYECVSDGGVTPTFSWVICPTFEAIMGETVGRFERDATTQDILGEYFNLYEDIINETTGDVITHRNAATGQYSTAKGFGNTTAALASSVEGSANTIGASSNNAHVEGSENSLMQGNMNTHVEGSGNSLMQGNTNTHIEGANHTIYSGVNGSHIEGYNNATGANAGTGSGINYIHIEGQNNQGQSGSTASHIEGYGNTLKNNPSPYTHVEGYSNEVAYQNYGHIEGSNNSVTSTAAVFSNHVEGQGNTVVGVQSSHIEGNNTVYGYGSYQSHVEGQGNVIGTTNSPVNLSQTHIEGQGNTIQAGVASLQQFHIEGLGNEVENKGTGTSTTLYGSHIEGQHNSMDASVSHIEGSSNTINHGVINSHVEGIQNEVSSFSSHTEGSENINEAPTCHIEGSNNSSTSNASNSHLEGTNNLVNNSVSHVEGSNNEINAPYSHAEGTNNIINVGADSSHIEGSYNTTSAARTHTAGYHNINETSNSTIVGQYNLPDSQSTAQSSLIDRINYTLSSQISVIEDPSDPDFWTRYGTFDPSAETGSQTSDVKITDCTDGIVLELPAGLFIDKGSLSSSYGVIVVITGTITPKKIVRTADALDEIITINITKEIISQTGATSLSFFAHVIDDTYPNIIFNKVIKSLFVIGNGTGINSRSNVMIATSNDITINGNLVVNGGINTTSETITASNSYYAGHIRQDGECPFRYRRMLYFGTYVGDEHPLEILDNSIGYHSLQLESYAGLPTKIMKMIENSIYSEDGKFKANMRHIVSYYCALLSDNMKSRVEITSITASNTTFSGVDGKFYHYPVVNYIILPPYDNPTATGAGYAGAAILDIVFNNFQA